MKNEPKIRIKGFEGEWKETRLGNISSDCSYGIAASTIPYDGCHKYIRITDIDDRMHTFKPNPLVSPSIFNDSYLVKKDDILIARTGASVGKTYLYHQKDGKLYYAGYLIKMHIESADSEFIHLQTLLQKYSKWIISESQRSGQPGINLLQLLNYSFNCPALPEQRAIATYFRHLDSLIETADKKVASLKQVKEASLQSMFPKEGQKVPEVRFKGFDGEWKTSKLSTFAKRVTRKNGNLETELPVTISSQDGIIAQTQFFNSVVASSNLRGYYLIKKGEFAYNKSYSNGYPYGSVKRLEKYEMGALSTLYIVFALSKDIDHDYVIYFFETMLWHNEVAIRAAEGARNHGLLNIGADDFLDIQIIVPPTLSEQRKIASFFVHLDKQIAIAQQRLDLLRRIKSACLNEMFV